MAEISSEYSWVPVGFHFARDPTRREWRFAGSRADMRLFPVLLRGVAAGGSTEALGLGPDGDFIIGVWQRPGIDDEGVFGPADSLYALAAAISGKLEDGFSMGFRIAEEFAPEAVYSLVFDIDDGASGAYYASPTEDRDNSLPVAADRPVLPPLRFSFLELDDDLVSQGLMHVREGSVFLEFEIKEEENDVRLPEVYETTLAFAELASVELKRSIFGPIVTITSRRMKFLEKLPSSSAGRVKLRFKRKDATEVERVVSLFASLLDS